MNQKLCKMGKKCSMQSLFACHNVLLKAYTAKKAILTKEKCNFFLKKEAFFTIKDFF